MSTTRPAMGRKEVARPAVPATDYHDEISEANFEKIKEKVAKMNDPIYKRSIVSGIDIGD